MEFWLFKEVDGGGEVVFSSKEFGLDFIKTYGLKFFDENGYFPGRDEDFTFDRVPCDLRDIKELM